MNWKPVKNYEGRYEVSDCGSVRKVACKTTIGQFFSSSGYCVVRLSNPRKLLRVHRVVAEAFIPNPESLPIINHIDCVRHNNHSWNLEWCTPQQNLDHCEKLGRMNRHGAKGKRSPNAKLTDDTVKLIKSEYGQGGTSWFLLAKKYKSNKKTIGDIIRNRSYRIPSSTP